MAVRRGWGGGRARLDVFRPGYGKSILTKACHNVLWLCCCDVVATENSPSRFKGGLKTFICGLRWPQVLIISP